MKIKATMRQMKDAKVDFISLVTRGANRIPFRTIKSEGEHEMLDLSKPLRMFKGEKPASTSPVIAGVALMAHDDATMTSITAALKAEGLEFSKTQKNEDGTIVLCNEGEDLSADTHVVRLSDNVAVVMKGFSPYSDSLSTSATFAEQVAAQGFYQGLRTANEAVYSTIANILYKSDSPTDASGKIATTLDAYKQYVTTLVKGLPAVAFKAEKAVEDVLAKKAEDAATAKKAEDDAKAAAAASAAPAKKEEKPEGSDVKDTTETKKEDAAAPEAGKSEGSTDNAGNTANDQTQAAGAGEAGTAAGAETAAKADEAKKADDPMVLLMQKLEEVSGNVKSVSEKVDVVAKAQKSTEEKVAELTQKAENTAKAVKSTVVAGAGAGDEPARVGQAKKSESDDPRTGCFDTAFLPGRRI